MFGKLGSPEVVVRRNALDAISEALSRGAGSLPSAADAAPNAPRDLRQDYALALVEKLLPCLSDRDLPTRNAAAALLGKLTAECVLPPLIQLCGDRDARTRSAAAEAVGAVFRLGEPAHALRAFLACAAPQQMTPAAQAGEAEQVGVAAASGPLPEGRDTAVERAVGILSKWAADVDPAAWPPVIDALLAAMAAAPGDSLPVRVASALGASMGSGGGPGAYLLARVHALLAAQPEPSTKVVDQDAVFSRLSPLLLLRVLPLEAFEDPLAEDALYGDLPSPDAEQGAMAPACIATVLLRRMSDKLEPDDVRRVAAELAGRLRPSSTWLQLHAKMLRFARGSSWPQLRSAIFAACAALLARGISAIPGGVPSADLLAELTRVLSLDPAAPDADQVQLMKTQLGCIDFLAALLAAQLVVPTRAGSARIVEIDAPDNGCENVLHALLALITCACETLPWSPPGVLDDTDALAAVRACCANAIIAAGRYAHGQARLALAQGVLPSVCRCVSVLMPTSACSAHALAPAARCNAAACRRRRGPRRCRCFLPRCTTWVRTPPRLQTRWRASPPPSCALPGARAARRAWLPPSCSLRCWRRMRRC